MIKNARSFYMHDKDSIYNPGKMGHSRIGLSGPKQDIFEKITLSIFSCQPETPFALTLKLCFHKGIHVSLRDDYLIKKNIVLTFLHISL